MSVRGALRTLRCRLAHADTRPMGSEFWRPLYGARALELGGPSGCFRAGGLLPVYPVLARLDGVQPSARTIWHQLDARDGYVPEARRMGDLYVLDDVELGALPDQTYDAVICSHVIEHIANPLRALSAWRRISAPCGHVLIVAPHMAGTFDHRRPVTPLEHIVADLRNETGEDDLTHLEEVLRLHDADRDVRGVSDPLFVKDLQENKRTRMLHHHTFTTASLVEILGHAGLQVLALEARLPHDIYVLGRWASPSEPPDNQRIAIAAARRSPFRVDRRAARRAGSSTPA